MKTSELMSKLNDITGIRAFNKGRISVLDSTSECLAEVGLTCKQIFIYNNCPDEVSKLIVEYYLTPLEEREEVKKYYLRFPKGYNRWYSYLAKEINKDNGEYDCSGKCIDNEKYKNIFTQKEIDEMPFDTRFFVKEEVK